MKRIYLVIVLLLAAGFDQLHAQKDFTIQQVVPGSTEYIGPDRPSQLQFTHVAGQLSWIAKTETSENLVVFDKTGKTTTLLTLEQFNKAVMEMVKVELKNFPAIQWTDTDAFRFWMHKSYWAYNLTSGELTDTKEGNTTRGLENMDMSPDGKTIAYTLDDNLYLRQNGADKQVTGDGSFEIVYAQAVHRNEFGIEKGTFFSPKGNKLAFYRMDQSMVTSYPIIDWSRKPAPVNSIKYPFAGDKSHQVTLGVYDLETEKILYVKTSGDPEQYLTNIAWSPDESKIYIAVVNRGQNHMWLNEYEASSGNFIRTLFEEKDEKYIEPLMPMEFVPGHNDQFTWRSNRDGYQHIYLYSVKTGQVIRQLTSGKWEVKQIDGFDSKGENLFFHGNLSSPVNQDFCKVNLKNGKVTVLTSGNGFHSCTLSADKAYAIDYFSNTTTPRVVNLVETAGGKSKQVFAAPDPFKGYNIGKLKLFSIKNNNGDDLYCRMFYPHDFDSTKKYPVVVYLYNGPHSQLVTNSWLAGADTWYHYMAQHDVIVFTLDGRGTDNRGKAFSQAIHRQLGTVEMEDQLSGVNYLKKLAYVDGNRMGVFGWSFGGFMTTSLMTRNAGVFKVGVAGGPVIDWSFYEIMYGERYMDSPQENKTGYDANNLLNHISKLKDKLLVIHGTDDDVVVWQHSLMLLKKSVEENVQVDYYVYPGHKHNVRGPQRVHLMDKISRYLLDNLLSN